MNTGSKNKILIYHAVALNIEGLQIDFFGAVWYNRFHYYILR